MSGAGFSDLFHWEWRRAGRTPLLWAILGALALSFLWGAINTAGLHQAQVQAHARTLTAEQAHRAGLVSRAEAYRAPPSDAAPEVPYWQDPTNVSGFSQYFLFVHAMKPHLPLSPLAAGVSDVAPSRLEVKLNALFGFTDSYDFENPRGLALGRFDLGFALAYLLPVALILLFGLLVTFERDRGMLRLVAAQATSPRRWIAARVAAILAWAAPVVAVALTLSLLLAGVDLLAVLPDWLAALAVVLGYMLFWTGIGLAVLSAFPGAASALGVLTAVWAVLTLGAPLAGATLSAWLDPAPSGVRYVDAQRRTTDAVQAQALELVRSAFLARADLRGASDRIKGIDHATRLTFLTPELERRLASRREAMTAHVERQATLASAAGYLVPPLGLEHALAILAGTDDRRHRRFEAQARGYQLQLRGILYPLVQREIAAPSPRIPGVRGRFSFMDFDGLPAFRFAEESLAARIWPAALLGSWFAVLGLAMAGFGLASVRAWPTDL